MTCPSLRQRQHGAVLIVGLIFLLFITLVVSTAFSLSYTNQKAVGNMQFRNEAIAAVNKAVEQVLSSPFTNSPAAEEINVDINNDNTTDYIVKITKPQCLRALQIAGNGASGYGSSSELDLPATPANYMTLWDIEATVTDATTGASINVHQGVQVQLSDVQYSAVCT